jgi:hypothetical protein
VYLVELTKPTALFSVAYTALSVAKLRKFDILQSCKGWLPQSHKITALKIDDEVHCRAKRLVVSVL